MIVIVLSISEYRIIDYFFCFLLHILLDKQSNTDHDESSWLGGNAGGLNTWREKMILRQATRKPQK